jgi:hypothetical protein
VMKSVGTKVMVISWANNHARSNSGELRTSSGVMYTDAPAVRCGQSSQTAASNPKLANCVARSSAVTANAL